ncbi:nuclear envelope-associated protein 2-like [Phragmites australis]|uniref:nuclear envelope-associated protein 2-like n=1 Tax=Phragmites australis TaxID=29695 RepID=UPI002D781FEA|nr:nuclear envelope-associated protein 2-like [Phragmites australis]
MSVSEKLVPSSSASSSSDLDPLLKDLTEKKLSFRRNVVSLAAELKDVRNKLASQEQLFARESQTRKVAETKSRSMEEEVSKLQKCLQEKDEQLRSTTSSTEQYLHELDDLRTILSSTRATAEASAASAKSAQLQCLSLLKELNEKDSSLKEHEIRVNKLGEQLDLLQKDLQARELSQRQLKDEVLRIETDIMDTVAKAGSNKDNELLKILADVSPRNVQNLNNLLTAKDTEIARLRDEIRILSAHWTNKTKELESQLEKHRRTDQELKKRVLKLEFCLQESQSQMRKLKRRGEKRDKALKELMDQVAIKQPNGPCHGNKENFWESQGFKFIASMSMLALVMLAKR